MQKRCGVFTIHGRTFSRASKARRRDVGRAGDAVVVGGFAGARPETGDAPIDPASCVARRCDHAAIGMGRSETDPVARARRQGEARPPEERLSAAGPGRR